MFKKKGISTAASMMFGFDGEDPAIFKDTYNFLIKNRLLYSYWWPVSPLPGTPLYKRLKDQGRLKEEKWWLIKSRKYYGLVYSITSMEEEVFTKLFFHYYKLFYSFGNIIVRNLLPPSNWFVVHTYMNLEYRKKLNPQLNIIEY